MFKLIAKDSTTSALDHETGSSVKMMAFNDGRGVGIIIDGETISVPVEIFYEKMKQMFFEEH